MQDKYTGDIGDFGKYGLLRELYEQSCGKITLGINWYYVTREEAANLDGNHITYLSEKSASGTRFRGCFPDLYDKLRTIVSENTRRIQEIQGSKVLPEGTLFHSAPIPHSGATRSERVDARCGWLQGSLSQLAQADIIFLDPDTGIQLDQTKKGTPGAVKYAFLDEIRAYYRLGKSLVIYNHRDRRPREEYDRKISINRQFVKSPSDIRVLRFKRVSVRDFVFLVQDDHRDLINRTLSRLTAPPYDFLFEEYVPLEGRAMTKRISDWTHPSVTAFAGGLDPIDTIVRRARSIVLNAIQEGWSGPPFEPLKLAEYLNIGVVPTAEVFDARTVPAGRNRVKIEYNPDRPMGRTRFSLAHELAHTLFPDCSEAVRRRLHSSQMRDDDWQLELLCNIAAAEFVMPLGAGTKLEKVPVTVDSILRLRTEYGVSTEALSLRVVNLTAEPCTVFIAARSSDKKNARYRIDYSVPSRSSELNIPRSFRVPENTVLSECVAIGYTAKGTERWAPLPRMDIECIGIPAYPKDRWPRIVGIARTTLSGEAKDLRITYLRGDALNPRGSGHRIVAHVVNDKALNWGAGFGLAVAKKWPEVQSSFRQWVLSDRSRMALGAIHTTRMDDLSLVQLVAQRGYGPSKKPRIRYVALKECLDKLAAVAQRSSASIHMPRIGTGWARGDWEIITNLIDEALVRKNIEVTVYDLPTAHLGEAACNSSDLFGDQH